MRRSLPLIFLLFLLLIFWSFTGFCLFRRYETYSESFQSIPVALYTCLHCVLSRPSVLYRLQPLYLENNFAAIYFVLLTLVGDITFIALIIAIGTRNFRDFSAKIFLAKLKCRKVALESVFKLYSTNRRSLLFIIEQFLHIYSPHYLLFALNTHTFSLSDEAIMTFEDWILLGRGLGVSRKIHTPERAEFLFRSEDKSGRGWLDMAQFVRLMATISCSLHVLSEQEIVEERRIFNVNADEKLSLWRVFDNKFDNGQDPVIKVTKYMPLPHHVVTLLTSGNTQSVSQCQGYAISPSRRC